MRSSKAQDTSSRKAPEPKLEKGGYGVAWLQSEAGGEGHVLREEPNGKPVERHPFDLEERTARFGEQAILLCKRVPSGPGNDRIIDQLVGSATSVGANYCEANEAVSKRDFRFSISRCKKEAKEAGHFLRMAATAEPSLTDEARRLFREARELQLIFSAMHRK